MSQNNSAKYLRIFGWIAILISIFFIVFNYYTLYKQYKNQKNEVKVVAYLTNVTRHTSKVRSSGKTKYSTYYIGTYQGSNDGEIYTFETDHHACDWTFSKEKTYYVNQVKMDEYHEEINWKRLLEPFKIIILASFGVVYIHAGKKKEKMTEEQDSI